MNVTSMINHINKKLTFGVLSIALLTLSGCGITGAIKVKTDLVCYWHEPLTMDDETKNWLADLDWPEGFENFMESVGDDNELHDMNCGE